MGSITLPQSFIWMTALPLTFFLVLKNKPGLLHGVLLLRLELSVTAQEHFKAGRPGELSVSPPTSASVEPADDMGDNAYHRNGGETCSKVS